MRPRGATDTRPRDSVKMKEVEGYVEGEQVRSASLIVMIAIMILLFAVVFAVLGRGEYQPPSPEEHGSISQLA